MLCYHTAPLVSLVWVLVIGNAFDQHVLCDPALHVSDGLSTVHSHLEEENRREQSNIFWEIMVECTVGLPSSTLSGMLMIQEIIVHFIQVLIDLLGYEEC